MIFVGPRLACFTQEKSFLLVHVFVNDKSSFLRLNIIPLCIYAHFLFLFICSWTLKVIPSLSYYKEISWGDIFNLV
jgi:hypothetical protein